MTAAKIRQGGAWVGSALAGKVRVGGAWVDFGPGGGATTETLAWPSPPSSTDLDDGVGSSYGMGAQFYLSAGVTKNCLGVRWRVPDSVTAPGSPPTSHHAQLYRASDGAQLADEVITPTPGGDQDFLFTSPVALSDGLAEEYVAVVYTRHYVHRAPSPSSGWDVQSPSGNVHHQISRLIVSSAVPTSLATWSSQNAWYYISPIVEA